MESSKSQKKYICIQPKLPQILTGHFSCKNDFTIYRSVFGFPQILKSHHRIKKDAIESTLKTFLMESSRDPCNFFLKILNIMLTFKDAICIFKS